MKCLLVVATLVAACGDNTAACPLAFSDGDADGHADPLGAVQATGGFVVIAAYGSGNLDPVHPGKKPLGVANPIFVAP